MIRTFLRDLRYATRMLVATPGFTVAAIMCLALGIGATSAIFSVVHAVLLKPLGYREPQNLIRIYTEFPTFPHGGLRRFWTSPPEYLDLHREMKSWESLDAWVTGGMNLAGAADPIRVTSTSLTGGLLGSLGVSPVLGRLITPQDDVPGASKVIVISSGLWQRAFGGDRSVVGRVIQVDGQNANIVGVMPPEFSFPPGDLDPTEVWRPLQLDPANPGGRGSHFLFMLGRLRPGVSFRQAEQELAQMVRYSEETIAPMAHPFHHDNHPLVAYSFQDEVVRDVRPALWTLLGAVAFVLLIACVNVANLLLARAEARQREIAIRKALGAGLAQLVRQFTVEGLLLALSGAALGLALASAGLRLLVNAGTTSIPRAGEIRIDPTVLAVTFGVSVLTAVFFGLAPMAQLIAGSLSEALKAASGRASATVASNRFRSVLVAGELALALMLLIGTGLMLRAFWNLQSVHPGFRTGGILTMRVVLPQNAYAAQSSQQRFWQAVQEKVAAVPGVEMATAMTGLPPERRINANDTFMEGFTPVPNGPGHNIDYWQVAGDRFFETMGIRLMEGRLFDQRDGPDAPPTAIINQTMARTYYGNASPIGRRVRAGGRNSKSPFRTIVGVVEDVKNAALDKPAGTELFFPYAQSSAQLNLYLAVHTSRDPASLSGAVRNAVHDVDPSLPISQVRTMDDVLAGARSRPRFLTTLLSLFTITALVLAAVGLYGVIAYSVTRRTAEFGVRIALGAQSGDVVRLVVQQGLHLAAAGVLAGAAGAFVVARLIRSLLFGVATFDPLTFLAMAALLTAVTVIACLIPAARATKVDPLIALRYE